MHVSWRWRYFISIYTDTYSLDVHDRWVNKIINIIDKYEKQKQKRRQKKKKEETDSHSKQLRDIEWQNVLV